MVYIHIPYIPVFYIYVYGNYIKIYGLLNIRTGILDYLREGFSWPARAFKHTESNSFKHTATTFKYTNLYFILPPRPRGLARPPQFKCRYRTYMWWFDVFCTKLDTEINMDMVAMVAFQRKLDSLGFNLISEDNAPIMW